MTVLDHVVDPSPEGLSKRLNQLVYPALSALHLAFVKLAAASLDAPDDGDSASEDGDTPKPQVNVSPPKRSLNGEAGDYTLEKRGDVVIVTLDRPLFTIHEVDARRYNKSHERGDVLAFFGPTRRIGSTPGSLHMAVDFWTGPRHFQVNDGDLFVLKGFASLDQAEVVRVADGKTGVVPVGILRNVREADFGGPIKISSSEDSETFKVCTGPDHEKELYWRRGQEDSKNGTATWREPQHISASLSKVLKMPPKELESAADSVDPPAMVLLEWQVRTGAITEARDLFPTGNFTLLAPAFLVRRDLGPLARFGRALSFAAHADDFARKAHDFCLYERRR